MSRSPDDESIALEPGVAKRSHLAGILLIAFAVVGGVAGALLEWELYKLTHQPRSIAQLAAEKNHVRVIMDASGALLNTNDQIRFGVQLQTIHEKIEEWQDTHSRLVQDVKEGRLPESIREPLSRRVFPLYDNTLAETQRIFSRLEEADGKISIEEFRPLVRNVQVKTGTYLFYLDHLDLLLANAAQTEIHGLRKKEGLIILISSVIILIAALWLVFPARRALLGLHARLNRTIDQVSQKNQRLREMEKQVNERLKVALDVSKTGTFLWRKDTNLLEWDQNLARVFRIPDDKRPDKLDGFFALVHPEDREKVEHHIEKTLAHGYDAVEFRTNVEDGVHWIRDRSKLLDRDGKTMIGACTDETELVQQIKQAQIMRRQAEAACLTKTEFIAAISHDIRTPLSAILGFADVLKSPHLGSETERIRLLDLIIKNGNRLLNLVEELLDTSRIESGKEEVKEKDFDLKDLVEDLRTAHSHHLRLRNLAFEVHYRSELPPMLRSDPKLIERILSNLLSNAIRYSEHGSIHLDVELRPRDSEAQEQLLSLRVTDTGKGIPAQRHDSIFEPFTQRERVQNSHKSTGLGLFIARRLAGILGGRLTLERSEVGKGSVFLLSVPVKIGAQADHEQLPLTSPATGLRLVPNKYDRLAGRRVLVVEDTAEIQMLLKLLLASIGIDPTVVETGEEALALMRDQSFDIVLMDIGLPGMDGVETMKRARKSGYKGPMIAVSAHAAAEEKDRAFRAGASAYVTKPIEKNKLYDVLLKFREENPEGHKERRTH